MTCCGWKIINTRQKSSMIHSASPKVVARNLYSHDFEVLRQMDGGRTCVHGRTDILCENSDHYRPGLWLASWIKKKKKKTDECLSHTQLTNYIVNTIIFLVSKDKLINYFSILILSNTRQSRQYSYFHEFFQVTLNFISSTYRQEKIKRFREL